MATAALASPSKQSPSAMQRRARAGGIDEAPSSTSTARRGHGHGHSSSLSSPPTTLDKFFKSLLPQSAFPSSIVYAGSSSSTSTSAVIASPVLEASGTRAGELDYNSRPLSRSSSSSSLHQYASSPQYSSPSSPPQSSASPLGPAAAAGISKSKSRAPRSTVGAGKAAHAHRHNLSIDSSIPYASPLPSSMVTRTRSRTALQSNSNNNARAPSPASFYAGGIGESPANRSRQNSASSSLGSTHITSSMFSHRQSNSSATQQDAHTLKGTLKSPGSSRLNTASSGNTPPTTATSTSTTPAGNTANNTLPSIRGYTTFPENLNSSMGVSSTRPRTPLLDPFMRYRQQGGQASSSSLHNGLPSESLVGNEPPRLGLLSSREDPAPSESYVASLALAPLVSRPTRDEQPLYIAGGRTPDTLHAAPSSTYSTPALNASSPSMLYTASNQTGSGALPLTAGPTTRTGTMDSGYDRAHNAGLGMNPLPASSLSRPAMRPRSASVDSYMPQSGQDENNRHTRQHSGGLSGLSHFFHLRSSNSEDKAGVLGRSSSSRHKTRSRKGSLSSNTATNSTTAASAKIGSRFVHYGQPSPSSRPRTPNSTRSTRARQRSSSFGGAHAREEYQFPERDSPTHPAVGSSAHPRGRAPRAGPATNSRANSAFNSSSSLGRSKEDEHQKRTRNKLISARLPRTINHRDARLPSQPLGYTWICGSNSAARTPSFYDEFDYSKYPGGKRKRSISRSTITPRTYNATCSNAVSRSESNAGTANAAAHPSGELAYESEPEFLARHRARNAGKYGENAQLIAGQTRRSVDEATQTTPPSHTPLNEHPQVSLSGGLLTAQEEKALRRRSQSLINLRRTGSKDGYRNENHNIVISHPFRERSSELIRTPRTAPIPLTNEESLAVPPLFMGESAVISSPTAASSSTGHGVDHQPPFANMESLAGIGAGRGIRSDAPSAEGFRRTPSRASIEAINDPEKRREALFAALPPPTRRSPTPASAVSLHMYPTGKVLSPDPSATSNMASQQQYREQSDNTPTPRGDVGQPPNADVERLAGASSPPLDDYSQYEASRVIIGESDLLSPANAQERFPIVYGQAFSTAHESHEGEILNASSDSEDLSGLGLQREDSRESKLSRDSLTPLRDVGLVQIQRRQDTSGSAGSSASRSVSNGSARILDLREESFTNLFYRAPPPVKPLPSLPSSQSPSAGGSGSTSGLRSTPSPVPIARQSSASDLLAVYSEDQQQRPDSRSPEDRFPTPDFSVLQTFDIGDVGSEISSSDRNSRRDTLTHPFARTSTGHPAAGTLTGDERRQAQDDWANVDESLLQSGRQIWPISAYEEEENETLMVPPPMARNFTNSTARTVETFYTVGGGTSNASTSAFQAPSLHHQESFASARSHITASSAARTPQAELPPAPLAASAALGADRGQFIDDPSDDERERDIMATIRRTDLSPIFVPRPGIPAQFLNQQHARDGTTSPARDSRPTTARESDDEAINSNRDSFIEFEPVVPLRPRAPSDTRSFIDDDSDDDEPTSRPRTSESATGAGQSTDTKLNRPSVIVEHLEEDDVEQEPREYLNDGGLSSSLQPTSPLTPLSARSAISSVSHYSITPPDIIDSYTRSRESSNDPSRDSQSHCSLGLPVTPKVGDRSSGGSHTHSVSNVSIISSLSKLEDFPEPPPSNTPAYEKDEASAMMHHQPSRSTLGQDTTGNSLRPRGSSLPTGPHNQSRATINTQGTQTTSIYTFSSLAEGSGQKEENLESQPIQRGESSSSRRRNHLFEFPMRRNASKRSTAESFIDTTTSPTRETHTSPSIPSFDPQLGFSSSATSPDLSSPTNDKRPSSPGSSQAQHFRLSGIFARRPKHERTWSDPSTSHLSRSSLAGTRRDSGGFDSHEEKRQSWKGF